VVAKWAAVSVIGAGGRDGRKSTMRDDLDTILMGGADLVESTVQKVSTQMHPLL